MQIDDIANDVAFMQMNDIANDVAFIQMDDIVLTCGLLTPSVFVIVTVMENGRIVKMIPILQHSNWATGWWDRYTFMCKLQVKFDL